VGELQRGSGTGLGSIYLRNNRWGETNQGLVVSHARAGEDTLIGEAFRLDPKPTPTLRAGIMVKLLAEKSRPRGRKKGRKDRGQVMAWKPQLSRKQGSVVVNVPGGGMEQGEGLSGEREGHAPGGDKPGNRTFAVWGSFVKKAEAFGGVDGGADHRDWGGRRLRRQRKRPQGKQHGPEFQARGTNHKIL